MLLRFSRPEDPGCEPIKSLSSSFARPFRPHILQATTAIPPRRMAPPIPTTTPITIRFCEESSPDLLEPLWFPFKLGALVEVEAKVETAFSPLVVTTLVRVLLPLTVTTVVTNCCVRLLTDLD